jgi:endonuclease/exonuclease/phosphatase family metal-dependent hydrolase
MSGERLCYGEIPIFMVWSPGALVKNRLKRYVAECGMEDFLFKDYEICKVQQEEGSPLIVGIGELSWSVQISVYDPFVADRAREFKEKTGIVPTSAWLSTGLNSRGSRSSIEKKGSDGIVDPDFLAAFVAGVYPKGRLVFDFDDLTLNRTMIRNMKSQYTTRALRDLEKFQMPKKPSLRILSLNVHTLKTIDWKPAFDKLVELLVSASPDVLCLQEFAGDTYEEYGQFVAKMASLGYRWNVLGDMNIKTCPYGPFGNVIFSKLPIIRSTFKTYSIQCPPEDISAPFTAENDHVHRNYVSAVIEVFEGITLAIFNTHLDVFRADGLYRQEQLEEVLVACDECKCYNFVLCGDLNDPDLDIGNCHKWFRRDDTRTWTIVSPKDTITWTGDTVDYIVSNIDPSWNPTCVAVPYPYSDHYGILCDIE